VIDDDLLQSFSNCSYKAYRMAAGDRGTKTDYEVLEAELFESARARYHRSLRDKWGPDQVLLRPELVELSPCTGRAFAISPSVRCGNQRWIYDALQILPPKNPLDSPSVIPISIVAREKVSKTDRLRLAVKCIALEASLATEIEHGMIIYGEDGRATKFPLRTYGKEANKFFGKFTAVMAAEDAPPFCWTKHCAGCEYHSDCRTQLVAREDLSLLGGMSQREVDKLKSKGIFTVNQLSYTFRPRKQKRDPPRVDYALKALAIREQKTYVQGAPDLPDPTTVVYLDCEGLSDERFVYLIGMLITNGQAQNHVSLWADSRHEEEKILKECLDVLSRYPDSTVYHFGSYETRWLRRLRPNLTSNYANQVDTLLSRAVNVLTIFSSSVYPPTYTNGLKDIAGHLGFRWSEPAPSGLQSVVWRKRWELSKNDAYRQRLVRYNADDCSALKLVAEWIAGLRGRLEADDAGECARVEDVPATDFRKWGKSNYQLPAFEKISKCAYFDYQRSKVFFRTNPRVRQALKRQTRVAQPAVKANKYVGLPEKCPSCGSPRVTPLWNRDTQVFDIAFMKHGVKRWVTEFMSNRFQCTKCDAQFTVRKYGRNLAIWAVNQHVAHGVNLQKIGRMILEQFHISVPDHKLYEFKADLVREYTRAYEEIRKQATEGALLHVDETGMRGNGFAGYVWVFATMDSVFYEYRPTKEATYLHELLSEFSGVLVSDFYRGYDSIKCAQQRCLVHLIRDLNGDLLNNQMDDEFRRMVSRFADLLRNIITSVDKHGLQKRYLGKHKADVDLFYRDVVGLDYDSDVAIGWQRRFKRNRHRLFTFLEHDGVPWNNNNAENAVKPFAKYRRDTKGRCSKRALCDYLVLLSIQQTCKYRGINFLDFLRSQTSTIQEYCGES